MGRNLLVLLLLLLLLLSFCSCCCCCCCSPALPFSAVARSGTPVGGTAYGELFIGCFDLFCFLFFCFLLLLLLLLLLLPCPSLFGRSPVGYSSRRNRLWGEIYFFLLLLLLYSRFTTEVLTCLLLLLTLLWNPKVSATHVSWWLANPCTHKLWLSSKNRDVQMVQDTRVLCYTLYWLQNVHVQHHFHLRPHFFSALPTPSWHAKCVETRKMRGD